jgi:hypothetical protein
MTLSAASGVACAETFGATNLLNWTEVGQLSPFGFEESGTARATYHPSGMSRPNCEIAPMLSGLARLVVDPSEDCE